MTRSIPRRAALALAAQTVVLALAAPLAAQAQDKWPSKPLRIVVPYPAGGSSDIIARAISQPLSEALGQTVIVDNKPGANGNTGADAVAKANDGHTVLLCDVGALAISPSVYTRLPFDPSKDLKGITMLAYSPHLLVVHPSVKANSFAELVALSKKEPLNMAIPAIGSAAHVAAVAVAQASGARWEYVPYKGGAQAIGDTVAGQTQVLMNGMLATLPMVTNGKLRLLGVSKGTRMPLVGQVPTLAEQGVKGFESGTWQGLMVPASMPAAQVAKLNAELIRIIRSPAVRERLVSQGAEVNTMSPAEFSSFFDKERRKWAEVVKASNIRADGS